MAIVAPPRPRASIEEGPRGLEVVIPARRSWLLTGFLAVWLCGWAMGEVTVPRAFFAERAEPAAKMFAAVWLTFWTFGGGFVIYTILWSLAGRERLLVTPSSLSIQREVFGMGRVREYGLTDIRDLRTAPIAYNPAATFRSGLQPWTGGPGLIAFDYGSATIRFGAGLEEGEARSIVERLRPRVTL